MAFSGREVPAGLVDLEKDLEPGGVARSRPGSNPGTLRLPGNPGTKRSSWLPEQCRFQVILGVSSPLPQPHRSETLDSGAR